MIEFHGETDVGRRRQLNEDCIHAADGLFIVCDGMGGHLAGEVASRIATEAIVGFIARAAADPDVTWPFGVDAGQPPEANRLSTAIRLANRAVHELSARSEEHRGMGTTVVAALIPPGRPTVTYGHVGDSRLYLLRDETLTQLTRDDSLAEMLPGGGAPVMRNVLTKALGVREDVEVDVAARDLAPGDILLLCSDGLTTMLPDAEILQTVLAHAGDLKEACRRLIAAANAQGGRDNVSVVLVRYTG
jgi:protein phosphatase